MPAGMGDAQADNQTFGMKNKKGGKAQKYMQTVQKMSAGSGKNKEDVGLPFPITACRGVQLGHTAR